MFSKTTCLSHGKCCEYFIKQCTPDTLLSFVTRATEIFTGLRMPRAMCGLWGICGAISSCGAALAIIDGSGPLSTDGKWGNHMQFTAAAVEELGKINGPRCCKRDAMVSFKNAVEYVNKTYLLGKRSINPGRGKWSIPGGGFDVRCDEDLSNTAEREFWEETGIKFKDVCKTQKHDVMWIRFPLFTWMTILAETESADFMRRLNIREFSDKI